MNIEAVKKMDMEELLSACDKHCPTYSEIDDLHSVAELRADIERRGRGVQERFVINLWQTTGGSIDYCDQFQIVNASPRQVAEAYLMTVEEL